MFLIPNIIKKTHAYYSINYILILISIQPFYSEVILWGTCLYKQIESLTDTHTIQALYIYIYIYPLFYLLCLYIYIYCCNYIINN